MPEQGNINGLLAAGTQGREFNHTSGNFAHTATDAAVAAVGPPLSVSRTYNSLDPRTDGIFGAGWTTRYDMRIEVEPTGSLLVTYPGGEQLRFASLGNGTYAPPQGTFATLAAEQAGGWRLMDKSATSYWFNASGLLTKITDHRGRAQELTRGTDGKLTKVTATGGRSLTFTWAGNHVASVSTDPVDGNPLTWTYTYEGDQLVKVCPPTSATACNSYTYGEGSRYKSVITDSRPEYYYRLNEAESRTGTTIASAAGWNATEEQAKLNGQTPADLGTQVPGALAGSPDTAMRFKGAATSTFVQLPRNTVSGQGGELAVEAWFKTTASGTIIGMQNTADNTPSASMPVVYVGTDGKLRGQFFTGLSTIAHTPITSSRVVNDASWHHVVLSATETKSATSSTPAEHTQTLYLDGVAVGTLAGEIQHGDMWETRIGSGHASSAWPFTVSTAAVFPFNGDIDEVAVYGKPLGIAAVARHFAAGKPQPQLTQVTLPSGRAWVVNTYNPDGGRLVTQIDANGGQWTLAEPVYQKQTTLSTFMTVKVTDPNSGVVTYVADAQRGYRPVLETDQVGATTRWAYDVGGFPAKVIDANGNAVEVAFNERGNLLSKKTCRTTDKCHTEYYDYFVNVDKPFDPRNDAKVGQRDARSGSATDETYKTSWTYSAFGEENKATTPATDGFPAGRSMSKTYTDGTESAVGGGMTPAGLVKSAKDFKGNETTYAHSAAGDLVSETLPSGLVKKYRYDALGRVTATTEISKAFPEGVTTTVTYDGLGRVLTKTGPGVKNGIDGKTHTLRLSTAYNEDGLPVTETSEDMTGGDAPRKTVYTYDAYGRQATITGPEGGVEKYTYDQRGQKTSSTDARGTTLAYTYTPRGESATTVLKGWTSSPLDPKPATDVVLESIAYDPAGRMASKTDAMGRTTTYTYYADSLPLEQIAKGAKLNGSPTGRDVVLDSRVYDAAGQLVRQTTGGGTLRIDATFDEAGRNTSQVVDPEKLARKTVFTYDANNNVVKVTRTAAGTDRAETTEYAYDVLNQPVRQTVRNEGADLVTTLTVDDRGLVTETTDPRGNASGATAADFTSTLTYNELGLATLLQMPAVQVERNGGAAASQRPTSKLGYNTFGERTHQLDAEGRAMTTAYDRAGRVITQTAPTYTPPGGQPITPTTTSEYDAAGQLVKATDPRGQVTTAVYDGLGRKVQMNQSQAGTSWSYGFDLLGEALWTTDPTGARSESTYDDLGRQITLTTIERKPAPGIYVTKQEYDDAGRLVKTTRPTGDVSTRAYDATDAMVKHTDALGNTTTFGFDLAGRPVSTTNPLGLTSQVVYDLAGRKTETRELDAGETLLRTRKIGYDLAGNPVTSTSASGHTVTRTFDAANRVTSLVEPVSETGTITSSFGYDAAGAQTRATNGRGHSTYTSYNSLGLVESMIEPPTAQYPDAKDRTWTTTYDASGNPVATLAPGGVKAERTFDELNRLIKQTGSGAEAETETKTFGYDLAGRVIAANDLTFTLNDRGLLLKTSSAVSGDLSTYAYDANKRLVERVDATGTSAFTWDDADRLTQSVDPVSAVTIGYSYDKASRLVGMSYGANGARRTYDYDGLNRLTKDTLTTSAATPIASIEYGYDVDDNMTSKTTTGTAGAGKNTYAYDWANRLTSWTGPDGTKTDYGWDAAGNRVKVGDKTYTYDERNRLTSGDGRTYTYTARGTLAEEGGGMVRITKFDAFDRMVSDDGVQYDYDALDRVETRTYSGKTQRMAYDGVGNNLVTVTDTATGNKTAMFGRDALGRTLGLSDGAGAQLAFCDLRGDLIGAFSATGTSLIDSVAYNPFGEVTTRTGAAHTLGYQGGYTDPSTGKINMAARWYQPTTGSFISRDTLTQNPDPSVQLNRYTYTNDNPLTNTDPTGLAKKPQNKKTSAKKTSSKKDLTPKQEYAACKKQKFANKNGINCEDEADLATFNRDCKNGYSGYGDAVDACKSASDQLSSCYFKSGKYKACENKAVETACGERPLKGERACHEAMPGYKACRNTDIDRTICIEGTHEYGVCRGTTDDTGPNKGVCAEATREYQDCRQQGEDAEPICHKLRDTYVRCRSTGGIGNAKKKEKRFGQTADECGSVADQYMDCVKDGHAAPDCAYIGLIQSECLAKEKGTEKQCNGLAEKFAWCLANPAHKYCDGKPDSKCESQKLTGIMSCKDYYYAPEMWLMQNKLNDWEGGLGSPCEFSSIVTQNEKAESICAIVGLVGDAIVQKGIEWYNNKWTDFREKFPGCGGWVHYTFVPRQEDTGLVNPIFKPDCH
ncbi:RHS repeat-associated core domain-containing protein [Nonomuraea sp. NPDC052129]|uniref:RHS repeat-associated core domain-containing protein n=1 Tax=Nonomuraea sp. NPDC052129 TaxID=3154651 RepID=UPI00342A6BE3